MPRKKRVWYPGAVYHVMSRGNRRAAIYKDHTDYIHFLEILRTSADLDGAEDIRREDIVRVLSCRDLDVSNSKMYAIT